MAPRSGAGKGLFLGLKSPMIMLLITGDMPGRSGRSAVTSDLEIQLPLCCPCGSPDLYRRGLCESCYHRGRRARARFGGKRERILERDHRTCRVCYSPAPLVVHHRRPSNRPSALITLCRAYYVSADCNQGSWCQRVALATSRRAFGSRRIVQASSQRRIPL